MINLIIAILLLQTTLTQQQYKYLTVYVYENGSPMKYTTVYFNDGVNTGTSSTGSQGVTGQMPVVRNKITVTVNGINYTVYTYDKYNYAYIFQ